jgi:hypothetical protein
MQKHAAKLNKVIEIMNIFFTYFVKEMAPEALYGQYLQ